MPAPAAQYQRAIHWFRRDLRIRDNPALHQACTSSKELVPLYLLSEWQKTHPWTGPKRQQFLCESLEDLSRSLSRLGGRLILRKGPQLEEIEKLLSETRADALFLNKDPDPFGKAVETQLKKLCQDRGVAFHSFDDVSLHPFDAILKQDGTPYRVFTPFSKPWLAESVQDLSPAPTHLSTPAELSSLPLPDLSCWGLGPQSTGALPGGEAQARDRLAAALTHRIDSYDTNRDSPGIAGTSRLSQDLRWGTISVRELYRSARTKSSENYPKELGWRDFYFSILHHFPDVLEQEFNPDWRGLPWKTPDGKFDAWREGQTGFPIVDAGIRELLSTGFMHNRVRMIVAMFLTKDLHLDWRLGEQFFAQHLVDGEIASNNGGWQWSAGTGADAAPYFRIQNPWAQSKRHDPEGRYIRRWVPELAGATAKSIYTPPAPGQSVHPGYPKPILDHSTERDVTLALFKDHKARNKG